MSIYLHGIIYCNDDNVVNLHQLSTSEGAIKQLAVEAQGFYTFSLNKISNIQFPACI